MPSAASTFHPAMTHYAYEKKKKTKECLNSKTLTFIFEMKGYLQEKTKQWQVNVMYITKYKKYIIKKNKPHLQNAFISDTPVWKQEIEIKKINSWAYSWDKSFSDKTNPALRKGETHSLAVSACTWMFSARGHSYSNHWMVVHKQRGLPAIETAF